MLDDITVFYCFVVLQVTVGRYADVLKSVCISVCFKVLYLASSSSPGRLISAGSGVILYATYFAGDQGQDKRSTPFLGNRAEKARCPGEPKSCTLAFLCAGR